VLPQEISEQAIPQRTLGSTGLNVSVIGFGSAPLGSVYDPVGSSAAHHCLVASEIIGVQDTPDNFSLFCLMCGIQISLRQYHMKGGKKRREGEGGRIRGRGGGGRGKRTNDFLWEKSIPPPPFLPRGPQHEPLCEGLMGSTHNLNRCALIGLPVSGFKKQSIWLRATVLVPVKLELCHISGCRNSRPEIVPCFMLKKSLEVCHVGQGHYNNSRKYQCCIAITLGALQLQWGHSGEYTTVGSSCRIENHNGGIAQDIPPWGHCAE
jgi:hypothetical protein